MVLICISLMISDGEQLFIDQWPFIYLIWKKKMSVPILYPFLKLGSLVLLLSCYEFFIYFGY